MSRKNAFLLTWQVQLSHHGRTCCVGCFGFFCLNLDRLILRPGRFVDFQEGTDSIYSC